MELRTPVALGMVPPLEHKSAEGWRTVAEAARALGVTERAVRRRLARGHPGDPR